MEGKIFVNCHYITACATTMQQCHFFCAATCEEFAAAVEKFNGMTLPSVLNFPQGFYKC